MSSLVGPRLLDDTSLEIMGLLTQLVRSSHVIIDIHYSGCGLELKRRLGYPLSLQCRRYGVCYCCRPVLENTLVMIMYIRDIKKIISDKK